MPTRRTALALLAGGVCVRGLRAADDSTVAVVLDAATGKPAYMEHPDLALRRRVAPGSVIKPLVLQALLESGALQPNETHVCGHNLAIAGHSLVCVHPRTAQPMDVASALAYSCNEFVAWTALRFPPGELARALARTGLTSRTELLRGNEATGAVKSVQGEASQLQALGEAHITVTALGIAAAYQRMSKRLANDRGPASEALRQGLEGAVNYGTAQRAAVQGVQVAGKTGSAQGGWAWFAGFAPSREPRYVAAVLTRGYSGGADAAPIAGELFRRLLESRQ